MVEQGKTYCLNLEVQSKTNAEQLRKHEEREKLQAAERQQLQMDEELEHRKAKEAREAELEQAAANDLREYDWTNFVHGNYTKGLQQTCRLKTSNLPMIRDDL